jgi:hypothetical protein
MYDPPALLGLASLAGLVGLAGLAGLAPPDRSRGRGGNVLVDRGRNFEYMPPR